MAEEGGDQPATEKEVVGGAVDDVQQGCFGSLLYVGFILLSVVVIIVISIKIIK